MIHLMTEKRVAKWWMGGVSSLCATFFTHPLDLIKANLQTQNEKISIMRLTTNIIKKGGILSLYNGLSASLLRQATYSVTRFGLYEVGQDYINTKTFSGKVVLAGMSGFIGGFIGTPTDLVNVRMQNDMKLPQENRRNYKHAIDGLLRVYREEGFTRLFSGGGTASVRGLIVTIGQIAFYNQIKAILLDLEGFEDNVKTHLISSVGAAATATIISQPIDVLKTRTMNAKAGEFTGLFHIIRDTAKSGPFGFFKGLIPAFVRIGPHTVLLFIFLEQFRLHMGTIVK